MMRTARIVVVLAATFIAACFSKPGQPHLGGDDGTDDARTDTPGSQIDGAVDAPPGTCMNSDTFTTGAGCGAIGTAYGNASLVTRTNGQLSINTTGAAVGCRSNSAFSFAAGTSIKVVQLSQSGMTNTTSLTVTNAAATTQGMQVIFNNASGSSIVYDVQCIGGATTPIELNYDSSELYWKFEAVAAAVGQEVHVFHSTNGTAWVDVGIGCQWSSVANILVDIGVGATASAANQPALFDDFNVKTCP